MQPVLRTKSGSVVYFRFSNLERGGGVRAAFTTRQGGVSLPPYQSLNVGYHVGDDPEAVTENRARAVAVVGGTLDDLVAAEQVHGDRVEVVSVDHRGRGARGQSGSIPGADALITADPGAVLSMYFADCVPIFLVGPARRDAQAGGPAYVGGLAHAGWKGTVARIGQRTVEAMASSYAVRPEEVVCVIGPSIGPCCYEVDEPVLGPLRRVFPEQWETLIQPRLGGKVGPGGKAMLNLWEANRLALLAAGVRAENIVVAGLCTACRTDLFYSYRAERGRTGRMAALLRIEQGAGR